MNTHVSFVTLLSAGLGLLLVGCSTAELRKEPRVYSVAMRQNSPQPTYNRLTWVRFPDVLPEKELPSQSASVLSPVFHLSLKNVSLTEAAHVLGATARYAGNCEGPKCSRKVTLNSLGTIDELASELSLKSGVLFYVDHDAHEVRVSGRT